VCPTAGGFCISMKRTTSRPSKNSWLRCKPIRR
jgi:hypothetical protein